MKRTDGRGRRLSPIDCEALTRALELKRARSPADRREVDEQLKIRSWFAVALDAVYDAQMMLVRPRLWQPTPHDIIDIEGTLARGDDGVGGSYRAALLLKRMLAAGLSRYEPDPVRALEAKRRQRTATEPEPTT